MHVCTCVNVCVYCVCICVYVCTYVLIMLEIYSQQISNIQHSVVTIVVMLYITSPELIHFITDSFFPFINISLFLPTPSPWQPLLYILFLQQKLFISF